MGRFVADWEGFEPSKGLQTPYSLSRGAPSATRPPIHLTNVLLLKYGFFVNMFLQFFMDYTENILLLPMHKQGPFAQAQRIPYTIG